MQWLIKTIMETERVYLVKPGERGLYALGGVRIRYVNGVISIGGAILCQDVPSSDGVVLQLWTKDEDVLELLRLDVDIFEESGETFFSATSVRGMSSVLYSSKDDSSVMKTVSVTF